MVPADLEISTDPSRLDRDFIYDFLRSSYWARGRPRETVERSIDHSLCFGAYSGGRQVAFARAITDRAVIAYLADVFVAPEFRGRGISKALMQAMVEHPDVGGVQLVLLRTRDAHGLYAQFGFVPVPDPEAVMLRRRPVVA